MVFANIIAWVHFNPGTTAFMQDGLDRLQEKKPSATLKHQWVDYPAISNNLKRAVIASEDSGFVKHAGVEVEAMEKAFSRNLKRGRITHGGSTITQQLAKNLFLSPQRSYFRKAQELIITGMIEITWSKKRILEVYLNVVEWGNGVYGAQAAARYYFGVNASQLSAWQAAKLAAMLPNPRFYDKNRNSSYLLRKTGTVQARMGQVAVP
ncbi:MAG: monofunctional biosynthetic peptidoglycan transglycosylase [Limnobacter sp.]|nr:monofunctional biosynthetic peptidoglycan transglycosylase [Limnobacter sp.]